MSINKVILVGHVGQDPDVRFMPDGTTAMNFSVATNRRWTDRTSGELREETDWHRISVFDKLADVMAKFLKKGTQVYVEGRLRTRKWTDKDNVERYTTEVVAGVIQLLGRPERSEGDSGSEA